MRDQYPGNMMGSSVAIDGDTIAVGALGQDNINSDTDSHGAVHVFARDVPGDPNSGWTQIEKLRGEHDLPNGNLNGRSNVALNLGASVDIYGDVIIAGGVMQSADFVGAAYIFTRDQSGEPSSTWTQRDRIVTGEVQENFGARGVVVHGDLAMIASGGGRAYGDSPANKVRVYRLPCPELDITDPNTCSCDELMLLNGFQIADESSSPSSGCYGPAPTYLLPPPPAAAPSIRFIVTHPSTSDSEWYGDCACICNKQKYGDINVEGDVSGKGISFQVCTEQGPEKCRELASTHQAFDNCTDAGGKAQNFTTDWDYNSNYTGAIWTPPPPPLLLRRRRRRRCRRRRRRCRRRRRRTMPRCLVDSSNMDQQGGLPVWGVPILLEDCVRARGMNTNNRCSWIPQTRGINKDLRLWIVRLGRTAQSQ